MTIHKYENVLPVFHYARKFFTCKDPHDYYLVKCDDYDLIFIKYKNFVGMSLQKYTLNGDYLTIEMYQDGVLIMTTYISKISKICFYEDMESISQEIKFDDIKDAIKLAYELYAPIYVWFKQVSVMYVGL